MNAIEKMQQFLAKSPYGVQLQDFHIDYTDAMPANGGLFPSGLVEISRRKDILGNTTVVNQYNFALYTVIEKTPGDDVGAAENATWTLGLQEWIQEQSILGNTPQFGDVPEQETITAQNGTLYAADDEGTGLYVIQISATFTKQFWRS